VAKRGVTRRSRAAVALALGAFVVVMAGVVWRRTIGYSKAVHLRVLEGQVRELEAERSKLNSEIRSAMSVGRLAPVVARLGLTFANDSQIIRLPMPAARAPN